jgi:hypothetical protein
MSHQLQNRLPGLRRRRLCRKFSRSSSHRNNAESGVADDAGAVDVDRSAANAAVKTAPSLGWK